MVLEDYDSHKFIIISVPFGVLILIFLISWFIINQIVFKWRPLLLARLKISHGIKSTPNSCKTTILLILYWIFFLIPFLLFIAWGIILACLFKPYYFGLIIAIGPTAILLIIYIYLNYRNRGYVITFLPKFGLIIAFLLILVTTVGSIYFLKRQSWIEIACLFAFPPSLFFMISYTYSHKYIPNDVFESSLKSQEEMDSFIERLSNHSHTCFKGSKKLNFIWSLMNFLFSLLCNFLYQLNYWFKDRDNLKGQRDASFYTAISFFLVDFLLLLSQAGTTIRSSFFLFIFGGYAVKICSILFDLKYWLTGHGFIVLFLSTFLFVRFIVGLWRPKSYSYLQGSDENPLVKSLSEIMNKTKKIPKVTIILSFLSLLILGTFFGIEIWRQHKKTFAHLTIDMTQMNAYIALGYLSIPLSFMISSCFYLFNDCGNASFGSFILYILPILLLVFPDAFWNGLDDVSLLLRLVFPAAFIFVFSWISLLIIIYFKKKDSFKSKSILVPFIIYTIMSVIALAASIALPFACNKYFKKSYGISTKLAGFMAILVVIIFSLYYFFIASYLKERTMKSVKVILSLILSILFAAILCVCSGSLYIGLALFVIIMAVFCIAFAFSYTKHNDWIFSVGPYLIIAIPSLIIFVAAVIGIFVLKSDNIVFFVSILAFIFAILFSGSSLFFWLQKKNFYFNWASICSLICLFICTIAVIVFMSIKYKKAFIVASIVLLCIFAASLIGMLFFVISQSISNVIVVSNIFFPVRRLVEGRIQNIKIFNILYLLTFITCWFWGLFASVFFDEHPEYGSLASTGAIFLIGFITCYFITQFDSKTYSSLDYIHQEEIKYAVNTAMDASCINIRLAGVQYPSETDYESLIQYFDQCVQVDENVSIFLSAIKAELYISSEVAFRSALSTIHHYFYEKGYSKEDLKFLKYETGWSINEKLQIYNLLADIRNADPSLIENSKLYENQLRQQIANRMKTKYNLNPDNKLYSKILSKCQSKNIKFNDQEFNETTDTSSFKSQVYWKRIEDFYPAPMYDPGLGYNPHIFKQGELGDCYLVAAMVSISRSPQLIKSIFSDPINNESGVRCVNFHFMGRIIPVVVDTTVPFNGDSDNSTPKACRPIKRDDPWWAPIIEKAYAKHFGSYGAIVGGNSHVAFYRLIGGFPERYDLTNMKTKEMIQNGSLWKLLLKLNEEGSFLCCGSISGNDNDKTPQGIHYGHAYTILRVVEIFGNKLLQLKNPWGYGEWTGDWSDKSSKWTPKMIDALKFKDEEDGIFWMCFNDFVNNFRSVYSSMKLSEKFSYKIDGEFKPGPEDGASPFSNSVGDALTLPQWIIRCKKASSLSMQPTLRCIFEKVGAASYCDVVLAYNNGEKMKFLVAGSKFSDFGVHNSTALSSFQWLYEEPQRPVNLLIFRDKMSKATNWHFEIYSEVELEIEKLN